jgi:hypothetical protein
VARSDIHGVIQYEGKPVTDATVIFIASDNKTHLARLKEDGSYHVTGVAQGPVKVSIQSSAPRVAPRADPRSEYGKVGVAEAKDAARPRPVAPAGTVIPAIYQDPEKSGLAFDLKEVNQEWSIDLK